MYKMDMHVHTSDVSPCGKVPSYEVERLYSLAGYNGIVITDHFFAGYFEKLKDLTWNEQVDNYLSGYRSVLKYSKDTNLKVFLGMEIRFNENANDYLVYGFDEQFLKENENLYAYTLKEFNELIKNKKILLFQAHPYRKGIVQAPKELLYGIEVYNGNPRHDSHNELALKFAKQNCLKEISGSDFHQVEDIARGGIETEHNIQTKEELIELLEEGNYTLIRS